MSGVMLCEDMLVVLPTKHILRGFLFEATQVKDCVYLWRVVAPLYRPMTRVFLDYSTRIPNGERIYIDKNAFRESADRVRAVIAENIACFGHMNTPRDFLRHIGWMIGNSEIRYRFDLALTQYRAGQIQTAQKIFQQLDFDVGRLTKARQLPVDASIKQAAQIIATNPEQLGRLLDQWENQNCEMLGVGATRIQSVIQ